MKIEVLPTAEAVARRAAAFIAEEARAAARERGRFLFAVSGGATPLRMLALLASENVPWPLVHLFQVDERVVDASDPDRNLFHLRATRLARSAIGASRIHAMPVEEPNLPAAAARYAATLREFAGDPPVLDLVHLGLGPDGHTASLVPGDPALEVLDSDVAVTGPYRGHRRMTLTFPILERARRILWVVTGSEKAEILARLRGGDPSIPAARIASEQARLLADSDAAGLSR
ncbi:MAG TPA: 6-phosphogluconolactonase [Candidatus Eisenbacteria bacterium]|nr:6-phosphogluconolactonase [Candidatus Eisenbacteria bacterium]